MKLTFSLSCSPEYDNDWETQRLINWRESVQCRKAKKIIDCCIASPLERPCLKPFMVCGKGISHDFSDNIMGIDGHDLSNWVECVMWSLWWVISPDYIFLSLGLALSSYIFKKPASQRFEWKVSISDEKKFYMNRYPKLCGDNKNFSWDICNATNYMFKKIAM